MEENRSQPVIGHLEDGGKLSVRPAQPTIIAPYPASPIRRRVEDADLINPKFALRVFLQWWYVIVPVSCVLAGVAAGTIYFTFVPLYRASATLQISSQTPFVAYHAADPSLKSEEFVETQIELLSSDMVLEPVVTVPAIASLAEIRVRENAVEWLSKQIKVTQVRKSELYRVSFDSPQPESAALVVNAVVHEYFKVRRTNDDTYTNRVIELLTKEQKWLADSIHKRQDEMRELHKPTVGTDAMSAPKLFGGGHAHPVEMLQQKLVDAAVETRMLEVEIQVLEETIAREEVPLPTAEVEMAIGESEEIRGMRAQIASKKQNLDSHERTAALGKNDLGYKRLHTELRHLEKQLDTAVELARIQISQQQRQLSTLSTNDDLVKKKAQLTMLRRQEKLLRVANEEKLKELQDNDKSLELEFMRGELARDQRVHDVIAERAMALKTEQKAPGRVTLQRSAVRPMAPIERIPLKSMAIAILTSGCLPFALILLWELSIRRITDSDQLVEKSQMSVVGEVAMLPLRSRIGGRKSFGKGLSLFEESIDSLRVCLWLPDARKHVHVLAVCSAIHGEGKTSIASQLSVSMARTMNEPVLLIDADMRAPDIHHIFSIPKEPGLANLLDGQCNIDEAINTQWSDRLHVLPAGRLTKSPHKLLGGDVFANLLTELRARYRCIVIDTPPVLSASESLLLAKLADGALVCTKRNYSRERQVRLAYGRLVAAGAKPLGAVFNAVPTRQYAGTYGSYGYSTIDHHLS